METPTGHYGLADGQEINLKIPLRETHIEALNPENLIQLGLNTSQANDASYL
jgi:hypothetical protein